MSSESSESSEEDEDDLLEELELDFRYIDFNIFGESSTSDESDNDEVHANRIQCIQRMVPFYENRMDIFFQFFHDVQLVQCFRFNREGIKYVTGMLWRNVGNIYRNYNMHVLFQTY